MPDADAQPDLIRRAFANLKSVRDNLPSGYVHDAGFFKMYDQALDQLQRAGHDVAEWRMPATAIGNVDGNEFRAKVDAVLTYFTVREKDVQIGFHQ